MKTLAGMLAAIMVHAAMSNQATADTFGAGGNSFEIEFVTIGHPGNPPDTRGNPNPAGSVDYVFNIGKFEVSRDMVDKATAEGNLGIILDPMDVVTGGPRPDMPATGVSWNEAARFANWLNTSQGFPAAYKFSAQPGEPDYDANANIELWVEGDPGFNAVNPFRNSQARYFLPSVHEWYKAAYYEWDPDGGAGGYWSFPNADGTAPTAVARGTDFDSAVYNQPLEQGPADITEAGGGSFYGVVGLGGNVWEWEETGFDLSNDDSTSWRGVRGGSWYVVSELLAASYRGGGFDEPAEARDLGFRVASCPSNDCLGIPEPDSVLLAVFGALGLLLRRTCKRGQST